MPKTFLLFTILIAFFSSCQNVASSNTQHLENEVLRLNSRIDSLVMALSIQNNNQLVSSVAPKKNKKKTSRALSTNSITSYSSYSSPTSSYSSSRSSGGGQCMGITKKGYRCSRTVKSGNYCWQHG